MRICSKERVGNYNTASRSCQVQLEYILVMVFGHFSAATDEAAKYATKHERASRSMVVGRGRRLNRCSQINESIYKKILTLFDEAAAVDDDDVDDSKTEGAAARDLFRVLEHRWVMR